jgi:hypothetical protein
MDNKHPAEATKGSDSPISVRPEETGLADEKHGTRYDEQDMDRMGKLQQLRVSLYCLLLDALMR